MGCLSPSPCHIKPEGNTHSQEGSGWVRLAPVFEGVMKCDEILDCWGSGGNSYRKGEMTAELSPRYSQAGVGR